MYQYQIHVVSSKRANNNDGQEEYSSVHKRQHKYAARKLARHARRAQRRS